MARQIDKRFEFCLFLFVFLLIYSCDSRKPCEDSQIEYYELGFLFQLVSSEGNTLIGVSGTQYESEDVNVEIEDGTTIEGLSIDDGGTISFRLADQTDPINEQINNIYFLVLPGNQQYPENDIDTIAVSYILTDGHSCNEIRFEDLKVEFNGAPYDGSIFPNLYHFTKE